VKNSYIQEERDAVACVDGDGSGWRDKTRKRRMRNDGLEKENREKVRSFDVDLKCDYFEA